MNKQLDLQDAAALLNILKIRFHHNVSRHAGMVWQDVAVRLQQNLDKLWTLNEMERTGGEPDVVLHDALTDTYFFYDCAAESPTGRRSLCYDKEALAARKENKPINSAVMMAYEMGIELLNEVQYRFLQQQGAVDTKTSSWIFTPPGIRQLNGALFGDHRYAHVFVYHNGAESYYAARGFRGCLRV